MFRFVGTAGILVNCREGIPHAIAFKGKIAGTIADGVAYVLLICLIFGLL